MTAVSLAAGSKRCTTDACNNQARMGFRITRPSRPDMRITVFCDERTAPATATLLCTEHALRDLPALMKVLLDEDEPMTDEPCAGCTHNLVEHTVGVTHACDVDGCSCNGWWTEPVTVWSAEGEVDTAKRCKHCHEPIHQLQAHLLDSKRTWVHLVAGEGRVFCTYLPDSAKAEPASD